MQKNYLKCPVEFVDDLFDEASPLASLVGERKLLLVADQNVVQRVAGLGTKIGAYVKNHAIALAGAPVVLAGGERLKMDNFQSAQRIIDAVLKAELGAEDFVLALGGGTLFDVTGWAVAQVKGSPRLVRIPTTPAAMMDAAFASTASLNTSTVKDALTVPSVPAAVYISLPFASSVLDGVWRAGVSEAVRLAAEKDPKVLKNLAPRAEAYFKRETAAFEFFVRTTVELRQKKGSTDLGIRHASEFEPKSNWKLPHGYAVSIGTLIELQGRDSFDMARTILKTCGALDGLYHSRHILPPEVANF